MDLDRILCIKEERRVQGDNTISYKARKYQILPTETRFGFAKAKVEVQQKHLGGTIHMSADNALLLEDILPNPAFLVRGQLFQPQ